MMASSVPAALIPDEALASNDTGATVPSESMSIYLLYDERMTHHHPLHWKAAEKWPTCQDDVPDTGYVFENPQRIRCIHQRLLELEQRLGGHRFINLSCQPATPETILLAHSTHYLDLLEQTKNMSEPELQEKSSVNEDVYYCQDTYVAATLSCGGVVSCVDAVTNDMLPQTRAIAVVRPPGHHACQGEAMGFCYLNSVAVAAKYAIAMGKAKHVAIVDWDVHHGNGTQDLTYEDPNIMYISLHRFEEYFFPGTGKHDEVSDGTNVNIAWTSARMGPNEYAAAFSEIILPVLAEWSPDLILVSCGLDAAQDDLIGDCELTPEVYYHMTRSLIEIGGIDSPLIVALEGGYNIDMIAKCMEGVALALMDEPWDRKGKAELLSTETRELVEGLENDNARRLETARRTLVSYWDHNLSMSENRGRIKSTAARCLSRTIVAVESSEIWKDRLVLRRFVQSTPAKHTTPRTMRTRAMRQQQQDDDEDQEDELINVVRRLAL